jgi:hypothetical protein
MNKTKVVETFVLQPLSVGPTATVALLTLSVYIFLFSGFILSTLRLTSFNLSSIFFHLLFYESCEVGFAVSWQYEKDNACLNP